MRRTTTISTALATALLLAACGGNADDDVVVVDPAPTPIFAKDGTIINDPSVGSDVDDGFDS